MIYLAITPAGLADALNAATEKDAVWCGSEAVSEADYALMPKKPSRFVYSFLDAGAADDLAGALFTISEHHPGQRIWVESSPEQM